MERQDYRLDFIKKIAPMIQKEAFARGYKYPSAIIAQACLESRYGDSELARRYHNYFGLKCGNYWLNRVYMETKEEYSPGVLTDRYADFRIYDSMEDGVEGYFNFISTERYKNLLGAESAYNYLELIKADGYATSSGYVKNTYGVVEKWELTSYDWKPVPDEVKNEQNPETFAPEIDAMLDASIQVMALYVIKGYFGNGHANRKENIYATIRERVNTISRKESE